MNPGYGMPGPGFAAPQENLNVGIIVLLYLSAILVPGIGSWLVVILSSILYYAWRGQQPLKAKQVNLHGWLAWISGGVLWGIVYALTR